MMYLDGCLLSSEVCWYDWVLEVKCACYSQMVIIECQFPNRSTPIYCDLEMRAFV